MHRVSLGQCGASTLTLGSGIPYVNLHRILLTLFCVSIIMCMEVSLSRQDGLSNLVTIGDRVVYHFILKVRSLWQGCRSYTCKFQSSHQMPSSYGRKLPLFFF